MSRALQRATVPSQLFAAAQWSPGVTPGVVGIVASCRILGSPSGTHFPFLWGSRFPCAVTNPKKGALYCNTVTGILRISCKRYSRSSHPAQPSQL